jgi:hypothetical protein
MHLVAAIVVGMLGTYIVAMDWVPIRRWNGNVTRESARIRALSTLWHGSLSTAFALGLTFNQRWACAASGIWFTLLLALEAYNWWLPYLFGIYCGEITKEGFIARYADNVRFLPAIGDHVVVPDGQHLVMQVLTTSSAVLSAVAFLRSHP